MMGKRVIFVLILMVILGGGVYITRQISDSRAENRLTDTTYIDTNRHFTFTFPKGYSVRKMSNEYIDNSDILIVENDQSSGVQITIQANDDDFLEITPELIHSYLPDVPEGDISPISLGVFGGIVAKGVSFIDTKSVFEEGSREVWFTDGVFFYQVSAGLREERTLQHIISSWQFKK